MAKPLELDPREAWGEIRRQREESNPRPGTMETEPMPEPLRFPENATGLEARVRAVRWWGREMSDAHQRGDRIECAHLAHWWEEKVEGWAEDVLTELEDDDG